MKSKLTWLILLFTLSNLLLEGQEYLHIENSCNFFGEESGTDHFQFNPTSEAQQIVQKILDAAGALDENSFVLKESDVKNALATELNNKRYILYSTDFLEKFKADAKTKWAAYGVLAHEIGHHLNNHQFSEKDKRKRQSMELRADMFAGSVLRTLGASLEQAQSCAKTIPLEGETETHPPRKARITAITNAWKRKDEILGGSGSNNNSNSDNGSSSGSEKEKTSSLNDDKSGKTNEQEIDFSEWSNKTTNDDPPPQPRFGNITIVYNGDPYGCSLTMSINIGGYTFQPSGTSFTVSNIPLGYQNYSIVGQINCGMYGFCNLNSTGSLNVQSGGYYYVNWQNTAVGYCDVWLADQ